MNDRIPPLNVTHPRVCRWLYGVSLAAMLLVVLDMHFGFLGGVR